MKNLNWKKRLIQTMWLAIAAGTIVLFGAAVQKKEKQLCKEVKIEIRGVEQDMFIDEKDVLDLININGLVTNRSMQSINLQVLEAALEKNLWVKNAELFFDNNQVLHVDIEERKPVARIFTKQGISFYVDSNSLRLPLSDKISARVPVFTDFPSDKAVLSTPDSLLLKDVTAFGKYIVADSFWMAQVAQMNITSKGFFEMIPTIGDQTIFFGNADDIENKFNRLYSFYKQAWLQNGINAYNFLDVQYQNQLVAMKKGSSQINNDSAKNVFATNDIQIIAPQASIITSATSSNNTSAGKLINDSNTTAKKTVLIGNKKLINNKQNKTSGHALSVSHKLFNAEEKVKVKQENHQPKAVFKKADQ